MSTTASQVQIDTIDFKHSPFIREKLNQEAVEDYAALYKDKDNDLPPPVLFKTTHALYRVADGWHRLKGAKKAGVGRVCCEIRTGTEADCVKFALKANCKHGVRRTNGDKRVAVAVALKAFPDLSNMLISQMAGVSDTFVSKLRESGDTPVVGVDGKKYPRKRIKRTIAAPEPGSNETELSTSETQTENPSTRTTNENLSTEIVRDYTRHPIPKELLELWGRRTEFDAIGEQIQTMIAAVARTAKDPLFWEFAPNVGPFISELKKFESLLATAKPFCVCGQCQGRKQSNCMLCRNHGLTSKHRWMTLPEKIREIRLIADK